MFRYDRMNELAKEQGIKKAHLCRLMGKSQYYLRDAEKVKTDMSDENVQIIATALHTTPAYLRGETDIKNQPADDGLVNDDPELTELLQTLQDRPEFKMLFHTFKSATKEQIEAIVTAWEVRNNIKEE